ncbi:hypothetical protein SASPL_108031 [Salvia splendens]|uniref:Uncharacterized protein n=1 Tax=Salvia splendens TaxID=180675 RepID=A0A8X9A5U7_SALSN|nr:hypothetical protein SASPL_108031 [Salvia splendens]
MLRPIAPAPLASPPPIKFSSLHNPLTPNHQILKKRFTSSTPTLTEFSTTSHLSAQFDELSGSDWEFGDEEIIDAAEDDEGFPWEGAVMYRRNGAVSHLEYGTALESLGLAKVSSGLSKTRAFEMGLRLVNPVADFPDGTPVLISADVTRRKQKLRLDGIYFLKVEEDKDNYQCGEPAAQSLYSNFTLLLCEEPIAEPETINMGMIFGEDKFNTFETGDDDDASVDIDDQLHFPPEEKVIDISKNI